MDKTNMPLKRPRKHIDAFKGVYRLNPPSPAVERWREHRRESKWGWLQRIFKVFESVRDWFGGCFGGMFGSNWGARRSGPKPEKRYPLWFRNRVARRRRREEIAKESRRVNR